MVSHGHARPTAWYTAVIKRSNQTTVSNPDKDWFNQSEEVHIRTCSVCCNHDCLNLKLVWEVLVDFRWFFRWEIDTPLNIKKMEYKSYLSPKHPSNGLRGWIYIFYSLKVPSLVQYNLTCSLCFDGLNFTYLFMVVQVVVSFYESFLVC